jgi:hypothetical protein
MSAIQQNGLKSANDPLIPFISVPETIGTVQIRHDSLLETGLLTKSIRIINNDGANPITYRTASPSSVLKTVPPNSDETIPEWTSYLEINPNAVTGNGILERDLVTNEDAHK